ncbi:MAG: DUF2971 domain-containing protein [Hespellia sp.]|nr:DUF2971 domain-containing protein [Hespellia sp.]
MTNKRVKLQKAEKESILYHYTKSNGINGIMKNNCFWATKSDFLNDPNEFSYIKEIVVAVCKEYIKNPMWRKMFLKDILKETVIINGGKNKEYFVLAFSSCRDSITMWSEFGNKTGYNIGFDCEKIIRRIEETNVVEYHGFVIYDPQLQKRLIQRIINDYLPEVTGIALPEILELGSRNHKDERYRKACRKFQKIVAVYAMFFKHEGFAQEREYRFVFKKQKETEVLFREKDGFMIPYIDIQLSEERLPVKEIMVAPQNHIDLAKNGMEYMMRSKGYQVKISLSNIKLRY